ncbi:MAG: hypothetical protein WC755_01775 [Candidatus Woesearchaeota archaeon]|jgi:hypothetical protein
MATLFDGGLLASFSSVFSFLFVYVLIFGLLSKIKLFGDKSEGINAIFALCGAIFTIFSPTAIGLITFMMPWLVVILVVGLMIWIFPAYFDMKVDTGRGGGAETVTVVAMVVVIIIMLIGFASVYHPTPAQNPVVYKSETVTVTQDNGSQVSTIQNPSIIQDDYRPGWLRTVLSAKVLGVLLFLIIGAFAIKYLGEYVVPKK